MSHTRSQRGIAAAAVFFVLAIGIAWGQAAKPPVEAFGSLPAIADVQLSPDGQHFSALQIYRGRMAVVIYTVGAPPGTTPAILVDEEHYIKSARWASNDRLLVNVYQSLRPSPDIARTYPYYRTFSVDLQAKNPVMLLQNVASIDLNNVSSRIADLNLDEPNRIIMPLWTQIRLKVWDTFPQVSFDLFKADVATGKAEVFLRGKPMVTAQTDEHTVHWIMDGHGHAVARIDQVQDPLIDRLLLNKDGNWVEVAKFDAEEEHGANTIGLSEDGTQILRFDTSKADETYSIVGFEIATGKTISVFKHPKYDAGGLITNQWTQRALAAVYTDDTYKVHFFTPAMQALQKGLEAAFPGSTVILESHNLAFDKVIVRVSSASQPWTYYLLDRNTHFAGRIGVSYPGLHAPDLGVVKPYPYKARDGLEIPAYLTLPPGKTAKNLPVVIFPHGGPEARDSMDFDWWAQFMASRGYAVLQPNYRGSSGYGPAFAAAGFHQWGLKMQDDITDGVAKLVADGIADPKRICIVGASYGGYAALAGAAFTPNLYACAVSVAGVSDLPKFLRTEANENAVHSKVMSYLASRVGTTGEDAIRLKATSPALHADQVVAPVLLMHGDSDYTVRVDQSVEMYDALKAAGKPVELIRFSGDEDHYLEQGATRIRMLQEIEKFLAKHIGT